MADEEDLGFKPLTTNPNQSGGADDLGFVLESDEEQAQRLEAKEYDNPAVAAALGVGRGLSFGLTDLAARFLGDDVRDDVEKYRRYNPKSSIGGDVVGTVVPAVLSFGTSGAASAARLTAGGIAAKTGAKVTSKLASRGASRTAAMAAGTAAEGALLGAKEAVSDLSLTPDDVTPEVAAEVISSNVGLGALLGGGFSLGVSGAGALASKGANKIRTISQKFMGPSAKKTAQETLEEGVEESTSFFRSQLASEKPNAADIRNAADELGKFTGNEITPTAGMISDSQIIQGLESSLEQAPTIAGAMVAQKTNQVRKGVMDAAEGTLYNRTQQTAVEIGDGVKEGIIEGFERAFKPISKSYDDIAKSTDFIDVSLRSRKSLADSFMKLKSVKVSPNSATAGTIKSFARDLAENVKTIDDVKFLRSQVGDALSEARRSGNGTAAAEYSEIYKRLSGLRSRWIKRGVQEQVMGKEGSEIAKGLLKEIENADAGFKALKGELSELSKNAKIGRIDTVDQLMNALDKIPSEQITNKLMNTKNTKLLGFVKKRFPAEFEKMKSLKLKEIYDSAIETRTGEFSISKFVKATDKLSPEAQGLLFTNAEQRAIKNVKTLYQSFPKMMGPSGTPQGMDYLQLANLQGLALNMRDVGRLALYQGRTFMAGLTGETEKMAVSRIRQYVTGLRVARTALATTRRLTNVGVLKLDDASFMSRVERLAELSSDPNRLAEEMGKNTEGLSDDPALQAAVNTQAISAMLYLQQVAPKNPRTFSMFTDPNDTWKPSDSEVRKFSRVVRALDNPLSVIEDMRDGIVSPDSVQAVKTVYPELYSMMVRETIEQLSDNGAARKLNNAQKVQLSIFLGMPIDSSMSPEQIQMIQSTFGSPQAEDQAQGASGGGGGQKPRSAGLDKLSRDTASQTQTERLMNR